MFIDSLWLRYKGLEDPNFLTDARTHFLERFWETYLAVTFMELGLKPSRKKAVLVRSSGWRIEDIGFGFGLYAEILERAVVRRSRSWRKRWYTASVRCLRIQALDGLFDRIAAKDTAAADGVTGGSPGELDDHHVSPSQHGQQACGRLPDDGRAVRWPRRKQRMGRRTWGIS